MFNIPPKEGKKFKVWCKVIFWQVLTQNQLKTEILFIEKWKPEKWREWVWLTNYLLMKNCKLLKVNKVKNSKTLMVTRNSLVKEDSPLSRKDRLLLETETPLKLPITLSITPITSETSLMSTKVHSQSQDLITLLLPLSLILKVYNFLMELHSSQKKSFPSLYNVWEP